MYKIGHYSRKINFYSLSREQSYANKDEMEDGWMDGRKNVN